MESNVREQRMGACEKVSKKSLIYVNGLTIIGGLTLLVGGIVVKSNLDSYARHFAFGVLKTILDASLVAPAFFITLGSVFLAISLCGYCGAFRERAWLLKVYMICMLLIFLAVVSVVSLIYAAKPFVEQAAGNALRGILEMYPNSKEIADLLQTKMWCCGVDSYMDWSADQEWLEKARSAAQKKSVTVDLHPVPDSCCLKPQMSGCGLTHGADPSIIHLDGCSNEFKRVLDSYGEVISVSGILVASLLLLCLVFSCSVIKFVERTEHIGRPSAIDLAAKQV